MTSDSPDILIINIKPSLLISPDNPPNIRTERELRRNARRESEHRQLEEYRPLYSCCLSLRDSLAHARLEVILFFGRVGVWRAAEEPQPLHRKPKAESESCLQPPHGWTSVDATNSGNLN